MGRQASGDSKSQCSQPPLVPSSRPRPTPPLLPDRLCRFVQAAHKWLISLPLTTFGGSMLRCPCSTRGIRRSPAIITISILSSAMMRVPCVTQMAASQDSPAATSLPTAQTSRGPSCRKRRRRWSSSRRTRSLTSLASQATGSARGRTTWAHLPRLYEDLLILYLPALLQGETNVSPQGTTCTVFATAV